MSEKKTSKKTETPKPLNKKEMKSLFSKIRACRVELEKHVQEARNNLVARGDVDVIPKVSLTGLKSIDTFIETGKQFGY